MHLNLSGRSERLQRIALLTLLAIAYLGGSSALAQPIAFGEPAVSPSDGLSFPMDWEDFDGDGQMDVAVLADGVIKLCLNDGVGGLTQSAEFPYYGEPPYTGPPKRIVAADLDHDGHVDLSWLDYEQQLGSVVTTWYNSGDGINGTIVQLDRRGGYLGDFALVDISGDGLLDMVVTSHAQSINSYVNQGNRTFEYQSLVSIPHVGSIRRIQVEDVDGDEDLDIALIVQDLFIDMQGYYRVRDTLAVLLNNVGDTQFQLSAVTRLPWQDDDILASDLVTGDLDGDGDLDLLVTGWQEQQRSPNVMCLLENRRGETLRIAATYLIGEGGHCRAVMGDFNTNGRLDIAFADESAVDDSIDVFANEGRWEFTQLDPLPSAVGGGGVLSADLSGDGQLDLVRSGTEGLAILNNTTVLVGPGYEHTALMRGQEAEFSVTGAQPGDRVNFLFGIGRAGFSRGYRLIGGITLNLVEPFSQFGAAVADQEGRAAVRMLIPVNAPLRSITTQAVIRRGPGGADSVKTPFRTARITE